MQRTSDELNPFGYWPSRSSAIAGLREGGDGADPTYAFHTDYFYPAPGPATFMVAFEGLDAAGGALQFRVNCIRDGEERPRKAVETRIALSDISAGGGCCRIAFTARPNTLYALVGRVPAGSGARATRLTVGLHGRASDRRFRRRVEAARDRIFGQTSSPGRRWWWRRSPAAGDAILHEPARLADPVSQTCTAAQFEEPAYDRWIGALGMAKQLHRKQWEQVYILQVLERYGALEPGARGVVFGVGVEALPALLAGKGCIIVATDQSEEAQQQHGWSAKGQYAGSLARLHHPALCSAEAFAQRVTFRAVDMNDIPDDLQHFDFAWSACAYEHLGSIEAGLTFFRESVRRLRPGGIAVHTGELNLTSNSATVDHADTVLFRRRDMERLAAELRADGHEVAPIKFDLGNLPADDHVDLPPYGEDLHLKLAMRQFVTTSFGMIARRGSGR